MCFVLIQLVDKSLEMHGNMVLEFAYIVKAYDTVHATMGWLKLYLREQNEEYWVDIECQLIWPISFHHSYTIFQQEDQHEGWSQEDDVCKRSGHSSRQQTGIRRTAV